MPSIFLSKVDLFTSEVLEKCPEVLGGMSDYFQVTEFQQRGTPHIHMMEYMGDFETRFGPKDDPEHMAKICAFIDKFITCSKQAISQELIVGQTHKCRPTTCLWKKNKTTACRFNYPQVPMDSTCILEQFIEAEIAEKDERAEND